MGGAPSFDCPAHQQQSQDNAKYELFLPRQSMHQPNIEADEPGHNAQFSEIDIGEARQPV